MFDQLVESITGENRYGLRITYKGRVEEYKNGDELDEAQAEALFAESNISLHYADFEKNEVIFYSRNMLELDLNDPNILNGLEQDGLDLEIIDLNKKRAMEAGASEEEANTIVKI